MEPRKQGETRELSVVLTDIELVQAGTKLCVAVEDADYQELYIEERRAEWREALKTIKEELSHRRKIASEAAEIVRTGKEKRDVACTWKYALAAGWAFLVRDDTGEPVQSRKLKDEERQLSLGEPPFAEPTPEELEEWLKTLPVNEKEVLPEGHAGEVGAEVRAVELGEDETERELRLLREFAQAEHYGDGALDIVQADEDDPESPRFIPPAERADAEA